LDYTFYGSCRRGSEPSLKSQANKFDGGVRISI
jgi:hypothetical protein